MLMKALQASCLVRFAAQVLIVVAAIFSIATDALARKADQQDRVVALADLPPQARETLARIKQGGPFPFKKDGVTFMNRERRLPPKLRGYYREYTVITPGSRDRGARRIISGGSGADGTAAATEYWYTADHYQTFRRIEESP